MSPGTLSRLRAAEPRTRGFAVVQPCRWQRCPGPSSPAITTAPLAACWGLKVSVPTAADKSARSPDTWHLCQGSLAPCSPGGLEQVPPATRRWISFHSLMSSPQFICSFPLRGPRGGVGLTPAPGGLWGQHDLQSAVGGLAGGTCTLRTESSLVALRSPCPQCALAALAVLVPSDGPRSLLLSPVPSVPSPLPPLHLDRSSVLLSQPGCGLFQAVLPDPPSLGWGPQHVHAERGLSKPPVQHQIPRGQDPLVTAFLCPAQVCVTHSRSKCRTEETNKAPACVLLSPESS